MANAITTITKYLPYLDQVYAYTSRSAVLDSPAEMVRQTEDAKTVLVAKTSMTGLGDYDRNSGFKNGDVSLTWESHTLTKDRGRSFMIDAMDNVETLGTAFGTLASEFIRTKVVPELDAYRFATYATKSGHSVTGATLTGADVVEAIDEGMTAMKEAEIDLTGSFLFATPTLITAIKQSDKFSRSLDPGQSPNRNMGSYDELTLVEVPQTRFHTSVTLGEDGFVAGGKEINFMIVQPAAVLQIMKHAKLRVFDPDTNQQADAYKVDYRVYHDAWVLDNKVKGIYAHTKA